MTEWHADDGLLDTFRTEVSERLASLSTGLLSLEARPDDPEVLSAIFRDAHTIKGSARMMGFVAVKEVAHRMEDILGDMKDGRLRMTADVADVLLACVDLIPELVGPAGMEPDLPPAAESMVHRLESARNGHVVTAPAPAPARLMETPPLDAVRPYSGAGVDAVRPYSGAGVDSSPPVAEAPASESESGAGTTSIRIEAFKVYELIDLVGEATVAHVRTAATAHSMVALSRSLEKRLRRLPDDEAGRQQARTLMAEALQQMAAALEIVDDAVGTEGRGLERLQEQAMRLAMLPTTSIFAPYPRIVRDLCRDLGKEVDLHMDGGDTELDKQVLERIVDPLRHLLVNAVDHGIESPDDRVLAGKPRRGSLTLRARQQGRQVVIEIEDDGRGISAAAVRDTALRRDLIAADEELSEAETFALLFQPGFSTSRMVTDLSGRGVGLDVVKTAVDQLKGTVEVQSTPGEGTRFLVTLPITLAIVEGVMVSSGGQTFAIPVSAVEEVVAVPAHALSRTGGRETAVLRGRTTPVVALHQVLGLLPDADPWGPVVVVTTSTRRVAFRLGSVQGQSEVVVKGLGTFVAACRYVAGATISPDGSVVLVLDPVELVEAARRLMVAGGTSALPERVPGESRRLLVVDDSLAIREMNRSILEAAGYRVDTAQDGIDGLERLAAGHFDGVVTDIEMPRMNGFELTTRIRADASVAHLPVIILTSLVRDEDRRRGLAAGADAYLTKSGFDQKALLEVIEGLVRAGGRRE